MTRNPEIGNPPFEFCPRLGRGKDIKFGTNAVIEMLLNSSKCQGYSFYRFGVLKVKPRSGEIRVVAFRAWPAYGMTKKGNILRNLGQFEDEPPEQHANLKFLGYTNTKRNSK